MTTSKPWDWTKENYQEWEEPSDESHFIAYQWRKKGVQTLLDFGCGLGRHAIYFAKQGFTVHAFDLSTEGVSHLNDWAKRENLSITTTVSDMKELPYKDNSFDGLFSYHVISHTDTKGAREIIGEITRVLKVGGELYITLCSKETWSFTESGFPKIDENTVMNTAEGPEKGIPHFYVLRDDIFPLLENYTIERIRLIDNCYFDGTKKNNKHYHITAKLKTK